MRCNFLPIKPNEFDLSYYDIVAWIDNLKCRLKNENNEARLSLKTKFVR